MLDDILRLRILRNAAILHDQHAVGQGQRLLRIMCDNDCCQVKFLGDRFDLLLDAFLDNTIQRT